MKGKKKWLLIVIIMLIVIAPFTVVKAATPPKLKVPKKEIRVNAGSTKELKISTKNASRIWELKKVTTSGKKIMKVSANKKTLTIKLSGKKQSPKTATVKLFLSLKKSAQKKYKKFPKNKVLTCKVRVIPAKPEFSASEVTMKVGETTQINVLAKKQVKNAFTLKSVTASDQSAVINKKDLSITVQGKSKGSIKVEMLFEMKKKVWKKYKKYSKPRIRKLSCIINVVESSTNTEDNEDNDDENKDPDPGDSETPELKEIDTSGWRFDTTSFVYNGTVQKPELVGLQNNVTPTYSGDINAINAGNYTLTVKFSVPEGFKEVADMTTEFTIQKAIPSYELPQGLEATYGDTLAEVALPEGFSFQVPLTTSVGNAGSNQFAVTYTPEDTENYEVVTGINIVLTVKKAKVSMMLNDASFDPETNQITADLQGLVDDTTVKYTVNGVTSEEAPMISAPGRYEISAELADTAQNYEGIKKVDANFNFKRRKNWYEISLSPTVVQNQLLVDVCLKNVKVKFEADYTMMMLGFNLNYDKSVLEFEEMIENETWAVSYNPDRDQNADTNDVVAEFFSTDPMQEETRICTMVYNIVDLPKFENVVFTAEDLNASTGSIDLPFEYTADGETIVLNPTEDGIKEYTIYMDWDLMKDAAYTLEKTRPQDKERYQEALQRHISEVFMEE